MWGHILIFAFTEHNQVNSFTQEMVKIMEIIKYAVTGS